MTDSPKPMISQELQDALLEFQRKLTGYRAFTADLLSSEFRAQYNELTCEDAGPPTAKIRSEWRIIPEKPEWDTGSTWQDEHVIEGSGRCSDVHTFDRYRWLNQLADAIDKALLIAPYDDELTHGQQVGRVKRALEDITMLFLTRPGEQPLKQDFFLPHFEEMEKCYAALGGKSLEQGAAERITHGFYARILNTCSELRAANDQGHISDPTQLIREIDFLRKIFPQKSPPAWER